MKLFLGTNCPQCEALTRRVDLDQVPGLAVHRVPDSGLPRTQEDADALAAADFHDIHSVPALVSDGRSVRDVFAILDELKGAMEGEADGR